MCAYDSAGSYSETWCVKTFMGGDSDTLRKNAINFMNTNELTFKNCRLFEYLGPREITVIAVYYLK